MGRKIGRPTNKEREQLRLADRRSQVLQMTIAGKTTDAIAGEFELSRQTISNDLRKALESQEASMLTGAAEVRRIQHLRLTQALDAIWIKIKEGNLDAIATMVRLLDREAKLLGLDAPQRIDVRRRIEDRAEELGYDSKAAVAEFERLIRENSNA